MADVTYHRPYPGGWVNLPTQLTPRNATALNAMDAGIQQATDQANLALRTALAAGTGGSGDVTITDHGYYATITAVAGSGSTITDHGYYATVTP